MLNIPPAGPPPSLEDLKAIATTGIAAAVLAWTRTELEKTRGRKMPISAQLITVAAGGFIGLIFGALCNAYGVSPIFSIAVGSFLGAAGEFFILGFAKLGLTISDDPVGMVEKVVKLRTGQPLDTPPKKEGE